MYSREEVYQKTLEYFQGDILATTVWMSKYCLKQFDHTNQMGEHVYIYFEDSPKMMFQRIIDEIYRIEQKYPNPISRAEIERLLMDFKYTILGGSLNAGVGNKLSIISLSNCFVVGFDEDHSDSYGTIMNTDQNIVQISKRRGGVGTDLSYTRPTNSVVKNAANNSSGAVSWAERYSNSIREVGQSGRRGALMLSLSVKHPDAERFIDAKLEQGKITGANISIKLDDDFMFSVKEKRKYTQQYPIFSKSPQVVQEIDATELWNKIIHNAWKSAEPGVLFWDTILNESPSDCYSKFGFKTVSTNPCGEIPLCLYDACRLLAMNLYSYVDNPFTSEAKFNFEKFKRDVVIAQRIADDIVDLEIEAIEKIIRKVESDPEEEDIKGVELRLWKKVLQVNKDGRRTGLGILAEGDMLAALGFRYASEEGIQFCEKVHQTKATYSYLSSIQLAKERGCFSCFNSDLEVSNPFINRILLSLEEFDEKESINDYYKTGRRNIANLTIAPTGTGSLMTQTTSGIEPVFLPIHKRKRKVQEGEAFDFEDEVGDKFKEFTVLHPKFLDWFMITQTFDFSDRRSYENYLSNLSKSNLEKLVKKSPYYKSSSADIDWVAKVKMQGAIQKWVDHSISCTVNLPQDTSQDIVSEIYMKAWEYGCKGCTIYREGSRDGILTSNSCSDQNGSQFIYLDSHKRPERLDCNIHHVVAKGQNWVVVVGLLDNKPYEVFAFKKIDLVNIDKYTKGVMKKEGHGIYDLELEDLVIKNICNKLLTEEEQGLTRMISLALRQYTDIKFIVEQLNKVPSNITSFIKVISRTLSKYTKATDSKEICPECKNSKLIRSEGCMKCPNCGYSKCS